MRRELQILYSMESMFHRKHVSLANQQGQGVIVHLCTTNDNTNIKRQQNKTKHETYL